MGISNYLANNLAQRSYNSLSGDGGVLTPAQVLGSNLRFRLDAAVGWSAAAWVDTVGGLSLAGVGTPTRSVDGANFRGEAVVLFNGTNQGYDTGALVPVDIVAAAARPYMYTVCRAVTAPVAIQKAIATYDAAAAEEMLAFGDHGGTGAITQARVGGGNIGAEVAPQAVPSFWEMFYDAAGVRTFFRDGVSIATSGTGLSTTLALRRLVIGGAVQASVFWANYRFAEVGICSAVPSAAQRAALRTSIQARWNTP